MGQVISFADGKTEESMEQNEQEPTNGETTMTAPEGVRAFNQYGQEIVVPREEWRTNVLPGMVKEAWDHPDQLYVVILNSLNEGFAAEMTEAARHLHESDPIAGRGATMWGIVLMQTGRLAEAEELLAGFAAKHGEDSSVLVNLAKLYSETGRKELAETTLWRAVEVEPNHDNALGWYATLIQEQSGEAAARELLLQVAAMPASWRAQLWLARGELNAGNLAGAKDYYNEALRRAPRPVPPDFLMQMSGDLGAKGLLRELIELTAPHFAPEWHGIQVGNNLIKALVDTGNLEAAEQVKAALWARKRPDWKDALTFWDAEITRRRVAGANAAGSARQIQVGMLRIDGPIWLPPGSPGQALFSAKSPDAPKVTFLGGTAEAPAAPTEAEVQMSDAIGRMTRSLPLFFAEQAQMRTAAVGRAMLPWAVGPMSGFVVSGQQWPDETAVQAVSVPEHASDYVVTVHLDAEVEPWNAMLAFVRTSDGQRIGELEREFHPGRPEEGLAELADEVAELLSALGPATASPAYEVPGPKMFGSYLARLEQLLAVRCASMEGVTAQFLNGEHEILEGGLLLCLAEPENVPARLLLENTVQAMRKIRPAVVEEFAGKLAKLRADYPMAAVDVLGD